MDKMEQYKLENSTNDAVVDDVAAKAYIENFALETFNRGDEAQRTNKVNKQTADTFQASATFMDLVSIWGPLDPEFVAKIKFAKFHALRIAKAIKAGEDPNASNPVVERSEPENATMDDGIEAELKAMENDTGVYRPPTVESAPDSGYPTRPQSSAEVDSMPPLPDVTPSETTIAGEGSQETPVVDNEGASRTASIGGGYFPAIPGAPSIVPPPTVTSPNAPSDPADFYNTSPPAASAPPPVQPRPSAPTPHQMRSQPVAAPPPPMPAQPISALPPVGSYNTDDDSIMAAQKHARWAISALNFEDVDTAVKELRIALQNLGAS
jgi:vacuolar protein sorting-associated protein VTA1